MSDLHLSLLLAMRGVLPYGLPLATLLTHARTAGHRSVTQPEIEAALRDLGDRALAATVQGTLGTTYRLTALGVSTLKEEGH